LTIILFPVYFAAFDGTMLLLINRKRIFRLSH
jgi:hypothetical protein